MKTEFETKAEEHIASRGSADTRALYRGDLASWLELCRELGADPDKPSLVTAVEFRDRLAARTMPATVRRVLSALCGMYEVFGGENPFRGRRLQRPPADLSANTEIFKLGQVDRLIAEAASVTPPLGLRDVAFIQLLYGTGLRVSTVCSLLRANLRRHADGSMTLMTTTKKSGIVEVGVPSAAAEALRLWFLVAPPSKYVFPSRSLDRPLKRHAIAGRLAAYAKRAGIENASPHMFRASYITEALDAGVPLIEVQAAVHHSSPNMTQRYDRGARGLGVASKLEEFRNKK